MRNSTPTRRYFLSWQWLWPIVFLLALTGCGSGAEELSATVAPTPSPTSWPVGVNFATLAPPTAVVVQTTPSPLPPPTETPTPTPIVVIIEEGDTLLEIALRTGITVDGIISLNPGIRPELLSIGQEVILPPPPTPIFQVGLSTPIPLAIDATQIEIYRTPQGGAWIIGEVVNRASVPAENIQLQVSLQDSQNNPLGSLTTWLATSVIYPQQSAPFGLVLTSAPEGAIQAAVAVVGGNNVVASTSRYTEFVIDDLVLLPSAEDNGVVVAEGRVRNIGAAAVDQLVLIGSYYDSSDRLLGFSTTPLNTLLAPGESQPFSVTTTLPGGVPANGLFVAEAIPLEN